MVPPNKPPYAGYKPYFSYSGKHIQVVLFGYGPYLTSPIGYFPPNGYGLLDIAGMSGSGGWDWYDAGCCECSRLRE